MDDRATGGIEVLSQDEDGDDPVVGVTVIPA